MDEKSIKTVNRIFKVVMCSAAIALAIGAIIHNPGHLITAAAMWAIGMEGEIVKRDQE